MHTNHLLDYGDFTNNNTLCRRINQWKVFSLLIKGYAVFNYQYNVIKRAANVYKDFSKKSNVIYVSRINNILNDVLYCTYHRTAIWKVLRRNKVSQKIKRINRVVNEDA